MYINLSLISIKQKIGLFITTIYHHLEMEGETRDISKRHKKSLNNTVNDRNLYKSRAINTMSRNMAIKKISLYYSHIPTDTHKHTSNKNIKEWHRSALLILVGCKITACQAPGQKCKNCLITGKLTKTCSSLQEHRFNPTLSELLNAVWMQCWADIKQRD